MFFILVISGQPSLFLVLFVTYTTRGHGLTNLRVPYFLRMGFFGGFLEGKSFPVFLSNFEFNVISLGNRKRQLPRRGYFEL